MNSAAWRERLPGVVVAALLAWVANGLAGGLGDPLARNPLLVAVLLGLLIGNTFGCPDRLRPGLEFTTRHLLRLGVVLVGFRITLKLLMALGIGPVLIAVTELLVVFIGVAWLARKVLRLDRDLALLLAAGSAVCGAAAVLAIAAVTRARPPHAAIAITLVTLFGTLALLLYPIAFLGGYLPGLDDDAYGVFVGASIYELAQVYGAAYAVSDLAVNTATLVKLVKVLLLIPLLFVVSFIWHRAGRSNATTRVVMPWFVVVFVGVMLFNSAVNLPGAVRAVIRDVDLFLFVMVMIALGLDTRLARLREVGGVRRLLLAGVLTLAFTTTVTYALVRMGSTAPASTPTTGEHAATVPHDSEGERLFLAVGCGKCHAPSLEADDQRITLYSDLLLHDMGAALDDKIVQGAATGRDWRTTPLLHLRLRSRYLHDGRALTLRDAIIAHEGEGKIVRDRFLELGNEEQAALYRFLNSL